MPKCAWILIGALLALLTHYPSAANAVAASATWMLTHPSGLAVIASLALWHLTTHRILQPARHRTTHR